MPSAAILKYGNRTVTNQRIEAARGSTVVIRCIEGNNPNWKKGTGSTATSLPIVGRGQEVYQIKSSMIHVAILTISQLTPAKTGVYACHVGPSTMETVTVAVGEFTCIINSNTAKLNPLL